MIMKFFDPTAFSTKKNGVLMSLAKGQNKILIKKVPGYQQNRAFFWPMT